MVAVEALHFVEHRDGRPYRVERVQKGRHDSVADRLDHGAVVGGRHILKPVEMLLHQREGVEVTDPVVQRGRPLQVGEQQRDVLDADPLGGPDHLGPEQGAEGLGGEQSLAVEKRREMKGRMP